MGANILSTIEAVELLKICGIIIAFFAFLFTAANISELNKGLKKTNQELSEIKKLLAEKQKQDELDSDKK